MKTPVRPPERTVARLMTVPRPLTARRPIESASRDRSAGVLATRHAGDVNDRATLRAINDVVVDCRACPRLVAWREEVARTKRAAFATEVYWGRPIPSFGDPGARLLIIGLAPAAHGGNRTGRMFTGDRSGDWLYASLHRCGFANQPVATHRGDGLRLINAYIAAAVRCAPPANRPTPAERDRCAPYLHGELEALKDVRAIVALGSFAWDACLRAHRVLGRPAPRPKPRFGHGTEVDLSSYVLIGSYHPSKQNTFTGELT
jgi:uracil-DNA glycosylase family 4